MTPRVVAVATPEGDLPVKVFAPAMRAPAAVIVYMDAVGWRDELDAMTARYAEAGYLTLLPDLFHRLGTLRFPDPHPDRPLDSGMMAANRATTLDMTMRDTRALVDWAAASEGVEHFGAVGYCMGARHALAATIVAPERVLAAALLHGGQLVKDTEDSPHLLLRRTRAHVYAGFAADDETCPEEHVRILEAEMAAHPGRMRGERYAAHHGWTFPRRWSHDRAAAEHAFAAVLDPFARTLDGCVSVG